MWDPAIYPCHLHYCLRSLCLQCFSLSMYAWGWSLFQGLNSKVSLPWSLFWLCLLSSWNFIFPLYVPLLSIYKCLNLYYFYFYAYLIYPISLKLLRDYKGRIISNCYPKHLCWWMNTQELKIKWMDELEDLKRTFLRHKLIWSSFKNPSQCSSLMLFTD